LPPERIDVLPNGIDLACYRDSHLEDGPRLRDSLQLDPDAIVVGTVGSLTPIKCHDVLIRACARARQKHPELHLLVVGDGPLRPYLEREAQEVGIADTVHFAGWRDDVPAYLASMDAYVCSSASEGMSNAVLEAMAAGLPIIATDVGDNSLIVRDGMEGRSVPANDPDAMANALCQLVGRVDLRDRYAMAAKARAEDFRFDQVVEAYEAYYESCLYDPRAGTGIAGRGYPTPQPA
jgi:glycosyltransferase involved in cell wall biosynthesis